MQSVNCLDKKSGFSIAPAVQYCSVTSHVSLWLHSSFVIVNEEVHILLGHANILKAAWVKVGFVLSIQ